MIQAYVCWTGQEWNEDGRTVESSSERQAALDYFQTYLDDEEALIVRVNLADQSHRRPTLWEIERKLQIKGVRG